MFGEYLENIFSAYNPMQVEIFSINFVEQRLKVSHFEGSIIP